ncbi:hypothetical protein NW767_006973 [Fusarium falciforme]|nr:hypothetical protein NW767_006973 [Fusarium falciforme]
MRPELFDQKCTASPSGLFNNLPNSESAFCVHASFTFRAHFVLFCSTSPTQSTITLKPQRFITDTTSLFSTTLFSSSHRHLLIFFVPSSSPHLHSKVKKSASPELFTHRRARDIWPSVKHPRYRRSRTKGSGAFRHRALQKISIEKINKKWHKAFVEAHGFSDPVPPEYPREEFADADDHLRWAERNSYLPEGRWNKSMLKEELEETASDRPKLLLLWKLSFRLHRKDPLYLFNFYANDIDFNDEPSGDLLRDNAEWNRNHLLSEDFCDKLLRIMAHPMSKDLSFMLFLLKWAVICRTDDRRGLKETDIEMLDSLQCYIDPSLHSEPLGVRHEDFQQEMWERGGWPAVEAELLSMIWQKTTPSEIGHVLLDGVSYQVTASDFDTVIEALGATVGGVKLDYSIDFEAIAQLTAEDHPVGPEEFKAAFKQAWKVVDML